MTLRVIGLWLRMVSVVVPAGERARWSAEWSADLDAVSASGAGVLELVGLALGIAGAALKFRFEGATMDGWMKEVTLAVRSLMRRPGFFIPPAVPGDPGGRY